MAKQEECMCGLNETDMFSPLDKQMDIESGQIQQFSPQHDVKSDGHIEFTIAASPDAFTDLNESFLYLRLKVINKDGKNLTESDEVSLTNNILHSLFSDVSFYIGDTLVEGGTHNYSYKAYLQNLLLNGNNTKLGFLRSSGWYNDTPGKLDGVENEGYKNRKKLLKTSKVFDLCGPILLDIFTQNRFILPNVGMKLILQKNKPEFVSMLKATNTLEGCKIVFEQALLNIRRVKASISKCLEIEDELAIKNAIIPIQQTRLISFTIGKGSLSHERENLFSSILPKAVFVCMVTNEAFNGGYTSNPFNFQHFNVNGIALFKDGTATPSQGYKPDFEKELTSLEYISLLQSLNMFNNNEENGIHENFFRNGASIFGFNLCPNLMIGGLSHPIQPGSLKLSMTFSKQLENTINVVVMGIFDEHIQIGKDRKVYCSWKA